MPTLPPTQRYSPEEVWAAEFEPPRRDARRRADEARTEAFLDVPLELGGEIVRQMTAADMLRLDALGNPFIAGSAAGVESFDCHGFIWEIHIHNSHTSSLPNLWRRARFLRRLAGWAVADLAEDIGAYLDRMLLREPRAEDAEPTASMQPEPRTHFIAPLLVNVACEIGHIDPFSGRLLADIPLPRLIQYGKSATAAKTGEQGNDESTAERAQCVQRTNELNWTFAHAGQH